MDDKKEKTTEEKLNLILKLLQEVIDGLYAPPGKTTLSEPKNPPPKPPGSDV